MSSRTDAIWRKIDRDRYTADQLPPLCRIDDFLPLLPIGRSTVWAWVKNGLFPKPHKRGGRTVWHRADILRWLELVP